LKPESRKIWLRLNREFEFPYETLVLLKTALEAYDRMNAAREQIDQEGTVIMTPTGFKKPHPALKIEKEARAGFLQSWRALNLDIEGPQGD